MQGKTIKINIHALLPASRVNGPGQRGVIWVQGCPFNCPGCFNQAARKQEPNQLLSVAAVLAELDCPSVEGITISGGEPFFQAAGLNLLCAEIRARGLTVMLYSGYTLGQVRENPDPAWQQLLAKTDIFIDGLYRKDLPPATIWTGSGNQGVHFLSDRYLEYKERIKINARYEEINIDRMGVISVTGF